MSCEHLNEMIAIAQHLLGGGFEGRDIMELIMIRFGIEEGAAASIVRAARVLSSISK